MVFSRTLHRHSYGIKEVWAAPGNLFVRPHGPAQLALQSTPLMGVYPTGHWIPAADDPSDPRTWSVQHVFTPATQVQLNTWTAGTKNVKQKMGITRPNNVAGNY